MLIPKDGCIIDGYIDELVIHNHVNDKIRNLVFTREKIKYSRGHTLLDEITPTCKLNDIYDEVAITERDYLTISRILIDNGMFGLMKRTSGCGSGERYIYCRLDDGSEFIYATTADSHPEAYNKTVAAITAIFEYLKAASEKKDSCVKVKSNKKYYITNCCDAVISEYWLYCPKCGKKLGDYDKRETDKVLDEDATTWICKDCLYSMPLDYSYCGKCGGKLSWT